MSGQSLFNKRINVFNSMAMRQLTHFIYSILFLNSLINIKLDNRLTNNNNLILITYVPYFWKKKYF